VLAAAALFDESPVVVPARIFAGADLRGPPAVLEPAVLEPAVLEPAVLEPAVLEPAVLEPAVLEPAVPRAG